MLSTESVERTVNLLDAASMKRSLIRIAHEIPEHNHGLKDLVLVGIRTRGAPLARRLSDLILGFEGVRLPFAELEIAAYRDDLDRGKRPPRYEARDFPFPLDNKTVILVDDVLFTGRSCRAAIEALFDLGRPASIQLAVMIDRGHRELPIRPDYVGKNIPSSRREYIRVELSEIDGEDRVFLGERRENGARSERGTIDPDDTVDPEGGR